MSGGSSNSRAGRVRSGSDPWAMIDLERAYGQDGPEWRSHSDLAKVWNMSLARATERAIELLNSGVLEAQRVKRNGRACRVYRPVVKGADRDRNRDTVSRSRAKGGRR